MRAIRSMAMVLCVGVSSAALASARSGDYSVQLLSETGRVLPTFQQDGRSYAMGTLGQRYSLRLRNGSAKRVELVASVDGRDVLDGQTSAWEKRGYLVNPHSEVIIDGFRLSREQVAAFRFSSVHSSYASRMGDARDVGVIGVAIFPEQGEAPVVQTQQPFWNKAWGQQGGGAAAGDGEVKGSATGAEGVSQDLGPVSGRPSKPAAGAEQEASSPPSPTAAPMASSAAPSANANLDSARAAAVGSLGRAAVADGPAPRAMRVSAQHAAKKAAERPGLGTEFGEQRYSRVGEREFVRASSKPAAVLSLHYDNHEGLVAMGIDVDRRLELSREARLRQGAEPFRRSSPTYERSPALLAR